MYNCRKEYIFQGRFIYETFYFCHKQILDRFVVCRHSFVSTRRHVSIWNAWLFIALLFIPVLLLGIFLFIKNPSLLERRLDAKEKNKTQDGVVKAAGLMFFIGFIVAGLDRRFSWSSLPAWLVVLSSVILLISYALYAEVMRENAFLSRTIEIQEKQTVITTGLYGYVRHPMYSVTIFLFLSIPLVLGSWVSLIFFLPELSF